MDQGTTEPAAPPRLEYAPGQAVGDMTLTRSGGVTVITCRPSWRRVGLALLPIVLLVVPTVVAVGLGSVLRSVQGLSPGSAVVLTVGLVATLGSMIRPLVVACNPIHWAIAKTGFTVAFRRPMHVVHEEYSRAHIADVRAERVRVKNQMFKRLALVTVDPAGRRTVHARGRGAELAFVARAFREALAIGPDPLGESAYPPRPRWARTDRRVGRGAVVVTLRPPRLGWAGLFVIAAVLAATMTCSYFMVQVPRRRWPLPPAGAWCALAFVATLLAYALVMAVHQLRRRVTLTVTAARVTLSEQALFRQGRDAWPTDRVRGFGQQVRDGGRKADLYLELDGGSVVPLVAQGPVRDVRYIRDTLAAALARSQPTPVIADSAGT